MDLAGRIIAQEQRAAEDRLIADRRARDRNLRSLHNETALRSRSARRLTESVVTVRPPRDVIKQVITDEEYIESRIPKRKPSRWSRLISWIRRRWFHSPDGHTHRIIARAELKQYENVPNSIDDLMEVDEKGNKIKFPKWKVITVERGTTGKLIKVLFAGALVLEMADGTYLIAGWEHVAKL
jgi:hypothetical protein